MLRKIFVPKRDKVSGNWKKLHSKKLNDLYSTRNYSNNQIKKSEMGGVKNT